MVISARTWPSPGVSISSARQATGSSPKTSPSAAHAAVPAAEGRAPAAPGLARRVRRADRRAREHRAAGAVEVAGEDVEDVDEPARRRPEALRGGADAPVDRGARRGRQLAGHAPDLGRCDPARRRDGLGREARRRARGPRRGRRRWSASARGSASSSSKSTWTSANSSSASVPGRMKRCSSASRAVRVRRGSTTTTFPPRARIARSRPRMSGAVSRLPLEASGLAPRMSRWSVRSTSGTATVIPVPNMSADGHLLGVLVDRAGAEEVARAAGP